MMGAGEQEGVKDFHDGPGFSSGPFLPLIEQAQKWQEARGQEFSQAGWEIASQAVEQAREALGLVEGEELSRQLLNRCALMDYIVLLRPRQHPLLGSKMRASIDIPAKILEIFQPALAELADRLPPELRPRALSMVIAHELFHALSPDCPEPELAAHLFAARVCGSEIFPGVLDLAKE